MATDPKSDIKVGLLVIFGVIAFIASVLFVGGDKALFTKYQTYRIHLKDVQGLASGSIVSLSGLVVGNVKELRISETSDKMEAVVAIDKKFADRITESSSASVKTQGALGDKYIFIEPGAPGASPLTENQVIATSQGGDLFDVISERGGELENFINVVNELHTLLKNLNEQNRSALFADNMAKSSEQLHRLLQEGQKLLADVRGNSAEKTEIKETLKNLSSILKKVDKGEGSLGAIINDPTVYNRIVQLLGEPPRNQFIKPLIRSSIRQIDSTK